ncbi:MULTISPECIES: PfkB family carbohydrate kinase [Nocardia]|uniref:PfkB family carbohydrate kinase n=1 Tax=Nocardia TaxID=1817 RepID=UPI000D690C61|nr:MULTISPECIES: PfkB family carbohydrate kinase [Nocardia]
MTSQDARTVMIRDILTRLCTYYGLKPERLGSTEIDVGPLLELAVVREYARRTGTSPGASMLPVVRDTARMLPPTDLLIADATLSLGHFRGNPPEGIDLDRLYADRLGTRREYLVQQWRPLHEALHAEAIPATPTVKRLRTTTESDTFTALATLLASGSGHVPATAASGKILVSLPDSMPRAGQVTVIGDTVIDDIYRVDRFPSVETPAEADYIGHPGGKGLNRAVAAARLGLDVHLLSVLGDDDSGRDILDYLAREGVRRDLIKIARGGATARTAVIMNASGDTLLIGSRDERSTLEFADVDTSATVAVMESSDVVLLTFEHPRGITGRVLALLRRMHPTPQVILCPTPSVAVPQDLYRYLDAVDYIVATPTELARMLPDQPAATSADSARRLRGLGVRVVCAIEEFRCAVWSDDVTLDIAHFQGALKQAPGATAAFAAALAYRIAVSDGPLRRDDIVWATAAMIPTQKLGPAAATMPEKSQVDAIVALAGDRG